MHGWCPIRAGVKTALAAPHNAVALRRDLRRRVSDPELGYHEMGSLPAARRSRVVVQSKKSASKAVGEESAKRRFIRAKPDPLDYAALQLKDAGTFAPDMVGLIVDEAPMGGASIVVLATPKIKEGQLVRLKVGRLSPLRAEVRWVKPVEKDLLRVGFQFLE